MCYSITNWGLSSRASETTETSGTDISESCRPLFKTPGILILPKVYILEILKIGNRNTSLFVSKGEIVPSLVTDKSSHFIKKSIHYSGIKLFNSLPLTI